MKMRFRCWSLCSLLWLMSALPCQALQLSGQLMPLQVVDVVAEVSGVVAMADARHGQPVTAAQPLVALKSQDQQLELARRQAQQRQAQADLQLAQQQLQRMQQLIQQRSVSQSDLDMAIASANSASALLAQLEVEVAQAQKALDDTHIAAPIDGFVSQRLVEPGSWVNQGDRLYQLQSKQRLCATLLASERDLLQLSVGQSLSLWPEVAPQHRIAATISRIGIQPDADTRAYLVEVEVDNPALLLQAGMSVYADIETEAEALR